MVDVLEGLLTPYPTDKKYTVLEKLRAGVVGSVYDGTVNEGAERVYAWVRQSHLRALFPSAAEYVGAFPDGPNTATLAKTLDAVVPGPRSLERSLETARITTRLFDLLAPYITSPLPQRRIEGYCALACLCAQRRNDVG